MSDRPISAVIEHVVTTGRGGRVERCTVRVDGKKILDTAVDLDVIAHAITHAEAFLRSLHAEATLPNLLDRAKGHADELAHALRLITGGM